MRRRIVTVGVTAALVLPAGAGVVALIPEQQPAGLAVAAEPTGTPTPEPTPEVEVGKRPVAGANLWYDGDAGHQLLRAEGVEVLEVVDDPFGYGQTETTKSAAARLMVDGREYWALAHIALGPTPGGGSRGTLGAWGEFADQAEQATFDEWIAAHKKIHGDASTLVLATFPQDEELHLVPRAGATILDQRAGVDVSPEFSPQEFVPQEGHVSTAAAMVDDAQGERWFVLARADGGPGTDVTVRASEAGGATTLDEFLDYARGVYASGGTL